MYGRGTVYFFVITIVLCAAGFMALKNTPAAVRTRTWWQKLVAFFRFSAYRKYELKVLRRHTPTIGVMSLLGLGFLFFFLMTFAPQPYYWPSTAAFGDSPPLATRSGWMALGATPFMILFATKANMIATLTGVSHDKLIVFHTWLAWAVLALALLHTFPFIVYNYEKDMMAEMWETMFMYWTGVAAILPQAYLTFMSVPWIRLVPRADPALASDRTRKLTRNTEIAAMNSSRPLTTSWPWSSWSSSSSTAVSPSPQCAYPASHFFF